MRWKNKTSVCHYNLYVKDGAVCLPPLDTLILLIRTLTWLVRWDKDGRKRCDPASIRQATLVNWLAKCKGSPSRSSDPPCLSFQQSELFRQIGDITLHIRGDSITMPPEGRWWISAIGQLHQGKEGLIETQTQVIGAIVHPRWHLTESLMQGIALNLASFSIVNQGYNEPSP